MFHVRSRVDRYADDVDASTSPAGERRSSYYSFFTRAISLPANHPPKQLSL
jgi:hypothetical protein